MKRGMEAHVSTCDLFQKNKPYQQKSQDSIELPLFLSIPFCDLFELHHLPARKLWIRIYTLVICNVNKMARFISPKTTVDAVETAKPFIHNIYGPRDPHKNMNVLSPPTLQK